MQEDESVAADFDRADDCSVLTFETKEGNAAMLEENPMGLTEEGSLCDESSLSSLQRAMLVEDTGETPFHQRPLTAGTTHYKNLANRRSELNASNIGEYGLAPASPAILGNILKASKDTLEGRKAVAFKQLSHAGYLAKLKQSMVGIARLEMEEQDAKKLKSQLVRQDEAFKYLSHQVKRFLVSEELQEMVSVEEAKAQKEHSATRDEAQEWLQNYAHRMLY